MLSGYSHFGNSHSICCNCLLYYPQTDRFANKIGGNRLKRFSADARLIVVVRICHVVEFATIVIVEIVAVFVAVHRSVAMIVVPYAKRVLLLALF